MKNKGLLITLEGGEGSGKTTQILRLKSHLIEIGRDVIALREPGGTTISEQIREVVLSNNNFGMSHTTEVLLFQAARSQIYREIVLPSLELGKVVLMDRSRDSSLVYQGIVRGFGAQIIEQLNDLSTKRTYPDLTFLLDIPVEIGMKRRRESEEVNRLEQEAMSFHQQVRQAYLDVARTSMIKDGEDSRWRVVDANQTADQVDAEIWQHASAYLQGHKTKMWQDQLEDSSLDYREE